MIQDGRTVTMNCQTCHHSKLLSDATPTYECHAPLDEHDVMALLYEFVATGQVKAPFLVLSAQEVLHDAWPLRFRALTIQTCEGHSSTAVPPLQLDQSTHKLQKTAQTMLA